MSCSPKSYSCSCSIVLAALSVVLGACVHSTSTHTVREAPRSGIPVGACGEPGRDGVTSAAPRLDHADRDLDGDGRPEAIVVDRSLCTAEGNCYWNVFATPAGQCARYLGTFEGAALETLATSGDDHMRDVRAYWQQGGGRMLLQSYHYVRGGYRIDDVLQCKRDADDRIECAESGR